MCEANYRNVDRGNMWTNILRNEAVLEKIGEKSYVKEKKTTGWNILRRN